MAKEILESLQKDYDELLNRTIELIDLYHYEDPIEVYCLLNRINSFYINQEEQHQMIQEEKRIYTNELEKRELKGIQFFLNGGLCRHRSSILNDIYQKMDISSIPLFGYIETGEQERMNDEHYLTLTGFPNHTIVMVGKEEKYYLDPMNDTPFFKKEEEQHILHNQKGLYFFYEPKMSRIVLCGIRGPFTEYDKVYQLLEHLPEGEEKETRKRIEEAYAYLKYHSKELEEYQKENEPLIQQMKEKSKVYRKVKE